MSNDRVTFDPARPENYELGAQVGNAATPEGLTRVGLDGTGRLVVQLEFADRARDEARQERKPEAGPVTGEIPRERAATVLRQASQFAWDKEFPPRPGIPDEAIVVWTYRAGGEEVATTRAWLRDVENDPTMAPVLAALREGVAELTGGQVYL